MARAATVSLTDPLTGQQQPATIVSRNGSRSSSSCQATDSPRDAHDPGRSTQQLSTTTTIPLTTGGPDPQPSANLSPIGSNTTVVSATPDSTCSIVSAPRRVAAITAVRTGIKLAVDCKRDATLVVTALPSGLRAARIVGWARVHIAGGKRSRLVLPMSAFGRRWLRGLHKAAQLRITAVTADGRSSTSVAVSRPSVHAFARGGQT